MKRATGVVLVLAAMTIGGCGEQCEDDPDYGETSAGSLTTSKGETDFEWASYDTNMAVATLTFGPDGDDAYPDLTVDAPTGTGARSLVDLHALFCTSASDCVPVVGTLDYTARDDLQPGVFDLQLDFVAGASSGTVKVAHTTEDNEVCSNPWAFPSGIFSP